MPNEIPGGGFYDDHRRTRDYPIPSVAIATEADALHSSSLSDRDLLLLILAELRALTPLLQKSAEVGDVFAAFGAQMGFGNVQPGNSERLEYPPKGLTPL
jgi:hypothetical protein